VLESQRAFADFVEVDVVNVVGVQPFGVLFPFAEAVELRVLVEQSDGHSDELGVRVRMNPPDRAPIVEEAVRFEELERGRADPTAGVDPPRFGLEEVDAGASGIAGHFHVGVCRGLRELRIELVRRNNGHADRHHVRVVV
jgi:hypothetical protein